MGFVPALDRLEVREVSPRYLSREERIEIADLRHAGLSIRGIAMRIGRAPSAASRELRRNRRRVGDYRPFDAHRKATLRRARERKRRVRQHPELAETVEHLPARWWSPQQIARCLRAKHSNEPAMRLCHESIYQAIYQPGSALLRTPEVPAPGGSNP